MTGSMSTSAFWPYAVTLIPTRAPWWLLPTWNEHNHATRIRFPAVCVSTCIAALWLSCSVCTFCQSAVCCGCHYCRSGWLGLKVVGGCVAVGSWSDWHGHHGRPSSFAAFFTHVLGLVYCRADGRSTLVTEGPRNPKPKAAPASDFAWRFSRFLVGEELLGSPE